MNTRRACVVLAISMTIGLVTTVATAWVLSITFPTPIAIERARRARTTPAGNVWFVSEAGPLRWAWDVVAWKVPPGAEPLPAWVKPPTSAWQNETVAFGWPFPCFAYDQRTFWSKPREVEDAWKIVRRQTEHLLPLRPCGWHLAASVLVHALIPLAATCGIVLIRRCTRHRRGLCVRCGYNLHGLPAGAPCPECGPTTR